MQNLTSDTEVKMEINSNFHGAGEQTQHQKNDLLMEKSRSVIDAVLALNRLGSDDESSRPSSPAAYEGDKKVSGEAKQHEDKQPSSSVAVSNKELQADIDSTQKLYWLTEDPSPEDFNDMTFPQKMNHVLRHDKHAEIIAWLPSGRSFVVRDQKKFATDVIPKYFGKHIAYTSFTRRLARWGWQNIAKGTYFNKDFNRDHPEQCLLMKYNSALSNKPADAVSITNVNKTNVNKTNARYANEMLGLPLVGSSGMSMNRVMHSPKRQNNGNYMGNPGMGGHSLCIDGDGQMTLPPSFATQGQIGVGMFYPSMGNASAFSGTGANVTGVPNIPQGQMQSNGMMHNNSGILVGPSDFGSLGADQSSGSANLNIHAMQSSQHVTGAGGGVIDQPLNNMMYILKQQPLHNMRDDTSKQPEHSMMDLPKQPVHNCDHLFH
jgi:hypothetical protein